MVNNESSAFFYLRFTIYYSRSWQLYKKRRAFPYPLALGANAAAVFFDDRADDCEAEAGAFCGVNGFIRHAVKPFENAFQIAPRNTDAVVANVDLGPGRARRSQLYRDLWVAI